MWLLIEIPGKVLVEFEFYSSFFVVQNGTDKGIKDLTERPQCRNCLKDDEVYTIQVCFTQY